MDAHGGIRMRGFPARGDTAALVDRHIDDHRTRPHLLHHRFIHQGWSPTAGGQHRADHQISAWNQALQQPSAAHHAHQPAAAIRFKAAQSLGRAVQKQHFRVHCCSCACRVPAHRARTKHHHSGWLHAGAAPHQHAAAAMGFLQ